MLKVDDKYGVVWSNNETEIAQTGYQFDTPEQAEEIGRKGIEWFRKKWDQICPLESLSKFIGVKVDWTAEEHEVATGFYVDHGVDDNYLKWHEHAVAH